MLIAIASDHAGFDLKKELLKTSELSFLDEGPFFKDSVDYPDYAHLICHKILQNKADFGVLICASGIGMSIAANRFNGIRGALCSTTDQAVLARAHNNANIIIFAAKETTPQAAKECLIAFTTTPFEGGRHLRRVNKCDHPPLLP
jgi:ribose 5-phosphate isomerase B